MKHAERCLAPWLPEQVESLNGFQASGVAHEFTCGNSTCRSSDGLSRRPALRAAEDGWHCDCCGYVQDWAFVFMTDWAWLAPGPWSLVVFTGVR